MDAAPATAFLPHDFREASPAGAPAEEPAGQRSLKEIVDSEIAKAEATAIRRALTLARGNKSHAARLLRTNYTTLHAKMKRFGISARDFRSA